MARRRAVLLAAAAAFPAVLAASSPAALAAPRPEPAKPAATVPALPGSPTCGPSAASPTEPQTGRNDTGTRYPAPIYFAPDFPVFADSDVNTTLGAVGGFGGIRRGAPLHHTPVVFVHGNQADAQNWLDTMIQFQQQAGYTMQEMYALSYNGLANFYAGAPTQMVPSDLDQQYVEQNSNSLANGGHGGGDDDNVPDLCRFVEAVQWYTGSRQVDLVGHSLGVTIIRRFMELYPTLAKDVVAFVGIAGGNHGTSVCTDLASSYYGCDEIAPGTAWLDALNKYGETYAPTQWMTIYNGALGDPFFDPPVEQSPALRGADNRMFNTAGVRGDYHNDLRVDPPEVDTYLSFLLLRGQGGPYAATGVAARARAIAAAGAAAEAQNQQVPQQYSLASAPLCIPGLTGSQAGCDVGGGVPATSAPGGSGGGGGGGAPPAAAATLPNTAPVGAAGAGAGAAALAAILLAALSGSRCRRSASRW